MNDHSKNERIQILTDKQRESSTNDQRTNKKAERAQLQYYGFL